MIVIVARNVRDRIRGFLASVMLELAPGVYSGVRVSAAVREQVWAVLADWFPDEVDASIVMVWRDPTVPSEQSVRVLGVPPVDFAETDGLTLTRRLPSPEAGQ